MMLGPTHVLRTVHQGDGAELDVSVQLVKRNPPSRTFWVMVHPNAPNTGRTDLRAWLKDTAWASKVEAALAPLRASHAPGDQGGRRKAPISPSVRSMGKSGQGKAVGKSRRSSVEVPPSPKQNSSMRGDGSEEEAEGGLAAKVRKASMSLELKSSPIQKRKVSGLLSPKSITPIKSPLARSSPSPQLMNIEVDEFGVEVVEESGNRKAGSVSPLLDIPIRISPNLQPIAATPTALVPAKMAPLEEDVLAQLKLMQAAEDGGGEPLNHVAHWVLTDGAEFTNASASSVAAARALNAQLAASKKSRAGSRRSFVVDLADVGPGQTQMGSEEGHDDGHGHSELGCCGERASCRTCCVGAKQEPVGFFATGVGVF